jgi:hypothetical protein
MNSCGGNKFDFDNIVGLLLILFLGLISLSLVLFIALT